ncbi:hypothetical protein SEMRO_134_G063530.1 [Seminavis robusta]|uniref:Uncharacterized protein n=1 Tax=Seminavis robusta TaxID=568900 RepID=A0A9N8DMB5_9STRA|nr:hypothetical protein SEMRO_134_G063530.1 [Seminavis robusta]|eukprot:Sro134_g063530.1 n/a (195) ;mRNA; r:77098-77682
MVAGKPFDVTFDVPPMAAFRPSTMTATSMDGRCRSFDDDDPSVFDDNDSPYSELELLADPDFLCDDEETTFEADPDYAFDPDNEPPLEIDYDFYYDDDEPTIETGYDLYGEEEPLDANSITQDDAKSTTESTEKHDNEDGATPATTLAHHCQNQACPHGRRLRERQSLRLWKADNRRQGAAFIVGGQIHAGNQC